jgi:transposase-like protein|tara:strand:- start:169 stop:534 length:366 start_codon:yes stop_codon:yes gene_type:complete
VYDKQGVLAWHISRKHLIKHAKHVMQQALQVAGTRPEKIITDGLWQYPVGIYKAMGWSKKEHRKRHIQDSGVGLNAPIERVNKEIKRRLKWFGSFQSFRGALTFFELWFFHFNKRIPAHVT